MMTARLGNEDEGTEAPIQAKAAEVARITPTWQGPVAETTTGICPAISGATPILSVLRAPGWILMSLLNLAQSSKPPLHFSAPSTQIRGHNHNVLGIPGTPKNSS